MITQLETAFHYVWSFALIISIIVFIHEFGHFLVARLCGVKVEMFSIGFGRELAGFTDRHGTRWKLALWPLGGFVKMYGDAGAASTPDVEALEAMSAQEKRQSFHHRPLWAKALIVAAGPAANFILAISVFTYFIFTVGINSTEPIVGELMPNTPAQQAGLKPGDRVSKIDGKEMRTFEDISDTLMTNLGKPVTLEVVRGEKHMTLSLTPIEYADKDVLGHIQKRPLIGIRSQKITYREVGLLTALAAATERTYSMCATTVHVLSQMIHGERSTRDLKGPLGIAKLSGEVTSQGTTMSETLHMILWFVALLSVNLGFVNLLPIPMLDGGHLAFYCVEALRGRPIAAKFQDYSYRLGFILIACLMALSLFNDMRQVF
jgi:regulator of sigma E protease